MRRHLRLLIVVFAALLVQPLQAQEVYSTVIISLQHHSLHQLLEAGLEADHGNFDGSKMTYSTTVSQSDLQILSALHVPYTIIIPDVTKDFLERNDPQDFFVNEPARQKHSGKNQRLLFQSPTQNIASTITTPAAFYPGSMGGYLTLNEIKKEIDSMKLNYPSLVTIDTIGYTYYSKPIWSVRITSSVFPANKKAQVLLTAVHHAREAITASNLIFFMQYILENYTTNASVKEMVDARDIYFVPCVNPDGYDYNYQTNPSGGGMHRKNRNPTGTTGSSSNIGVDPNRNYGYGWGYNNTGSSATLSADDYRGTGPFSEQETQAIRDLLRTHRFLAALNYHCYGGDVVIPPGVDTATVTAAQAADLAYFGAINATYNAYIVGTPQQTVGYHTNGGAQDFFYLGDLSLRPPCIVAEPELDCGTFWPSASKIIPYCKESFYGSTQTILMGGSYAKVEDVSPLSLGAAVDSFRFKTQRLGLIDSGAIVSIIPVENIDSVSSPVHIASLGAWRAETSGAIKYWLKSGLANGTRVRFVYKTVSGGITVTDSITKYYKPIVLFSDDMETGNVTTKWTVSSGWNYTTSTAFAGSQSLTESPFGNYPSNANLKLTSKTIIDLSGAIDATLSFYTKYKTENGKDKLQVKFSTNGNGTGATFTAFPAQHTIVENVGTMGNVPGYTGTQETWIHETINLKSLLGKSNVGLQFAFLSDGSSVADGFYLDNVEVAKINAVPLPILPSIVLSGSTVNNRNILSFSNPQQVRTIVQRSENAVIFNNLGGITSGDSYIDDNPAAIEYYRIQLLENSGAMHYSNIVRLQQIQASKQASFNNPVDDELSIKLPSGEIISSVKIYGAEGALVQSADAAKGSNTFVVSTASLSPGAYFFVVTAQNRGKVYREQFVKK